LKTWIENLRIGLDYGRAVDITRFPGWALRSGVLITFSFTIVRKMDS
jgi:hypothetical protein